MIPLITFREGADICYICLNECKKANVSSCWGISTRSKFKIPKSKVCWKINEPIGGVKYHNLHCLIDMEAP